MRGLPSQCHDGFNLTLFGFEQRMQSEQDGIPMERIYLDDLLPGEDSMQRSDLIADPMRWNRKDYGGRGKPERTI